MIYISAEGLPGFKVYPNPLQPGQDLQIVLNDRTTTGQDVALSLVSASGQVLYRTTEALPAHLQQLNARLAQAPAGLYLIRVEGLEGHRTVRLLKQ